MDFHQAWLEECLVDRDIHFLNCGTLAPTLRSAFDRMNEAKLQWMKHGPGASLEIRSARGYLNMMEEQDKCRHAVAKWLGASPTSVALLGNVTDGINAAIQSINWAEGDRIITSDEEHDALRRPLLQLMRRHDVAVDVVTYPKSAAQHDTFLADLRTKITPRTRLVALSEVSHVTGIPVSVDDVTAELLQYPEVFLLIDGAHAAGTTTDLIKSRIDFYTFPGHKWLFGPVETGVLWVSPRVLEQTHALLSGSPMMSRDGIRFETEEGAWRYEYGTRDWSKMVGLASAIEFRSQWSEQEIAGHYHELGEAFKTAFERRCNIVMVGHAPVLSFPTNQSNQIANWLWENHRVLVKPQERNIRISLPPWMTPRRVAELGNLIGQTVSDFAVNER